MRDLTEINQNNEDYHQGYQAYLAGKSQPTSRYARMGWVDASHQTKKPKMGVVSASQIAAHPNLSFSPKDYL